MSVEYHVGDKVSTNLRESLLRAFTQAASTGEAQLDVVCWDEVDAREYGGEDAVERYLEDPEASVFERFQIKVSCLGRVP